MEGADLRCKAALSNKPFYLCAQEYNCNMPSFFSNTITATPTPPPTHTHAQLEQINEWRLFNESNATTDQLLWVASQGFGGKPSGFKGPCNSLFSNRRICFECNMRSRNLTKVGGTVLACLEKQWKEERWREIVTIAAGRLSPFSVNGCV